ncbi:uncharacterized protein LOC111064324 [Nilaparvata lugens]|uniref:uncharacterized protein LOC111064324 n=1 Tax=Nilaparvata lugens TaxID=108931 RepID=UPI00193E7252|nr:uncharacterized protein LOC111064324 [Nilaparvata lugens]XP_039289704.1 uncharacterized protein LOC111064324 [Nilaparvata lugens]
MKETNNMQADITLDFDNADKARERRKRRSTIFEKSRTLANISGLNDTNDMNVDNSDNDWEKSYKDEMKKEINDWKSVTQSLKSEMEAFSQKMKNVESLTDIVPSQLLCEDEKLFLKGSDLYKTYSAKIDSTTEALALAEKMQLLTDNLISRSKLEAKFTSTINKMWLQLNSDYIFNDVTVDNDNLENLPYPEPFLQDFSCI